MFNFSAIIIAVLFVLSEVIILSIAAFRASCLLADVFFYSLLDSEYESETK